MPFHLPHYLRLSVLLIQATDRRPTVL